MSIPHPSPAFDKIVNPHLARMAMHAAKTFGEFQVIVRLAQPKHPPYLKVTGLHSQGHIKARVSYNQIERMAQDNNVLSIELREHVM